MQSPNLSNESLHWRRWTKFWEIKATNKTYVHGRSGDTEAMQFPFFLKKKNNKTWTPNTEQHAQPHRTLQARNCPKDRPLKREPFTRTKTAHKLTDKKFSKKWDAQFWQGSKLSTYFSETSSPPIRPRLCENKAGHVLNRFPHWKSAPVA